MTIEETLKSIVPGKTYPSSVEITEDVDGKSQTVRFLLQSYLVGMYCAIHWPGDVVQQTGGPATGLVTNLKKDIHRAIKRGAKIEIGAIRPVKVFEPTPPPWVEALPLP